MRVRVAAPAASAVVTDAGIELRPDPTRVVTRFFVPGREDVGPGDSRAGPVIERILGLDEADVVATLSDVLQRFEGRHRDLVGTFAAHAAMVTSRIGEGIALSSPRTLLIGASFTHEYSVEGAALCNPSAVLQSIDAATGDARFVLSVRGIGEGHRSSIGFRTGSVTSAGTVSVDQPGRFPAIGASTPGPHLRGVLHAKLAELDDDRENAAHVLDPLPQIFADHALEARIADLSADRATRRDTTATIAHLRSIARCAYSVEFPLASELTERVLWPQAPAESNGMEDARFVRFVDDDGHSRYLATYTAFDGRHIAVKLIETTDFRHFEMSPVAGAAASGKGLALFPRKVGGRYAALSRSDRETNSIAFSEDLRCWHSSQPIQTPKSTWEILQLGNCGSPIETAAGWLVLTHGVGPMRTYSLGVILLDLHEPERVIARSAEPIITPGPNRRDGYVPNVVYSCGGFVHNDTLVVPYGIADQAIAIATLSVEELLASLRPE